LLLLADLVTAFQDHGWQLGEKARQLQALALLAQLMVLACAGRVGQAR